MAILEQIGAVVITMNPVQRVVVIVTMIAIVLVFSNVGTTIVKPTILAPVATGAQMQIAATVLISFCFFTESQLCKIVIYDFSFALKRLKTNALIDPSRDCRGSPSTDWNCCSDAFPCMEGQGDCDEDSQCEGDLTCGADNCLSDFSTSSSNWVTGADCCTSG